MPVVQTTAYDQAEASLNLARSLVNDAAGAVFSDAVLMPFLNSAYRALQRQLAEAGVSVFVSQIDVDMPLTNGVTPTLLNDASTPQMFEKRAGLSSVTTVSSQASSLRSKVAWT